MDWNAICERMLKVKYVPVLVLHLRTPGFLLPCCWSVWAFAQGSAALWPSTGPRFGVHSMPFRAHSAHCPELASVVPALSAPLLPGQDLLSRREVCLLLELEGVAMMDSTASPWTVLGLLWSHRYEKCHYPDRKGC